MELSQPNSILRPSPRRPFERPTEHVAPTFDLSAVSDSESDDNDHVKSSRHGGTGAGAVLGTLSAENSPSLDSDAFSQSTGLDDAGRTRSILNLTSSTLRGIYTEAELDGPTEPGTPNGGGATGAHTPSIFKSSQLGLSAVAKQLDPAGERAGGSDDLDPATEMLSPISSVPEATPPEHLAQHRRRQSTAERMASMTGRATLLFGFGVAYGLVVTHLHKTTSDGQAAAVMPVPLDTADALGKRSPWFLTFWGIMGIILGSLLPWFDRVWADLVSASVSLDQEVEAKDDKEGKIVVRGRRRRRVMGVHTDWTAVVRSIGAFVGIAFAIRRLPWQSTLQASLALSLVNPVLWFVIDRSKPGFILSTVIGLSGMVVLLAINPEIVPSPAEPVRANMSAGPVTNTSPTAIAGVISEETIAVGTWIASILYCSCVCFGNIGRQLSLRHNET